MGSEYQIQFNFLVTEARYYSLAILSTKINSMFLKKKRLHLHLTQWAVHEITFQLLNNAWWQWRQMRKWPSRIMIWPTNKTSHRLPRNSHHNLLSVTEADVNICAGKQRFSIFFNKFLSCFESFIGGKGHQFMYQPQGWTSLFERTN